MSKWLIFCLLSVGIFACWDINSHTQANQAKPVPRKIEQQGINSVGNLNPILWHGPVNQAKVAITFDDGPQPVYTTAILKTLAKYHAKATFFLVGEMAKNYPDIVKQIVAEGHEIGSHTMSHPAAPAKTQEQLLTEVEESKKILTELSGQKIKFFRPPYGYFDIAYFKQCRASKLYVVLWSIVPRDWERPPADILAKRVADDLEPGSIILLHDGGGNRENTVLALELILKEIQRRQLATVTVSELFISLDN